MRLPHRSVRLNVDGWNGIDDIWILCRRYFVCVKWYAGILRRVDNFPLRRIENLQIRHSVRFRLCIRFDWFRINLPQRSQFQCMSGVPLNSIIVGCALNSLRSLPFLFGWYKYFFNRFRSVWITLFTSTFSTFSFSSSSLTIINSFALVQCRWSSVKEKRKRRKKKKLILTKLLFWSVLCYFVQLIVYIHDSAYTVQLWSVFSGTQELSAAPWLLCEQLHILYCV